MSIIPKIQEIRNRHTTTQVMKKVCVHWGLITGMPRSPPLWYVWHFKAMLSTCKLESTEVHSSLRLSLINHQINTVWQSQHAYKKTYMKMSHMIPNSGNNKNHCIIYAYLTLAHSSFFSHMQASNQAFYWRHRTDKKVHGMKQLCSSNSDLRGYVDVQIRRGGIVGVDNKMICSFNNNTQRQCFYQTCTI